MAGSVSGLHVFANDVGPIPLSLLDGNYNALQTALNTLRTFSNFYVDTGTTNNVNVTTDATQYVSYVDGLTVQVRLATTNTGPATLNINGLGPAAIQNPDGTAISAGELTAGQIMTFMYNAPRNGFQLVGGAGGLTSGNLQGTITVNGPANGNTTLVVAPAIAPAGAPQNVVGLAVEQGQQTTPNQWAMNLWGSTNPGASFGEWIMAGTNSSDCALRVGPAGASPTASQSFLNINGDGSGWLGPNSANALHWNNIGTFSVTGSATLPGGGTGGSGGTVTQINTGVGLTGGPIIATGTIALANTSVVPGSYINTNLTIDAQGRITSAASGTSGGGSGWPPASPVNWTGSWTFTGLQNTTAVVIAPAVASTGAAKNPVGLAVESGNQTTPNQWAQAIFGGGTSAGCSNGLNIQAGTNAGDNALLVTNATAATTFLQLRGDGSGNMNPLSWGVNGQLNYAPGGNLYGIQLNPDGTGWLGPNAGNALHWSSAGAFSTTGTATLPGGGGGSGGTVTQVNTGTGLTGGPITAVGTIALANTTVTAGSYTNTTLTVDAQGRITSAASGTGGGGGGFPPTPPVTVTGPWTINPGAGAMLTLNGAGGWTDLVVNAGVSPPASGMNVVGLAVALGAQTVAGQWAAHIYGGGAAAGCSNGLWISAGTNASDAAFIVGPGASTSPTNLQYFTINGDGSGFLGPNRAGSMGLTWDANAKFTFSAGAFTTPNQWQWQVGSPTIASGSTAGNSNGLQVSGGMNANDFALQVNTDGPAGTGLAGGQQLAAFRGDGSGFIGNGAVATPHGISWTAGPTPVFSLVGGATATWSTGSLTPPVLIPATGGANPPVMQLKVNPFTAAGNWYAQFGEGGTASGNTAGNSNGIFCAAGTGPADCALWIMDDTAANTFFQVLGNGDIHMPHVVTSVAQPNACIDPTTGQLTRSTAVGVGTFTGTLTGMTAAVTMTCTWSCDGKSVVLSIPAATGTSNATTMTLTGMPAAIKPATLASSVKLPFLQDNSVATDGAATVDSTAVITFYRGTGTTGTGWTASGTKGISSATTFVYAIQ